MADPGQTPGVGELLAGYAAGTLRPEAVLRDAYAAIHRRGADSVWIHLWLQARQEAASKDRDEFRLHREVCAGRMTLEQAQHDMLATWGPR